MDKIVSRVFLASVISLALLTTGCSVIGGAAPNVKFEKNVATLDESSGSVTLPLSSYMLTAEDQNRLARAQDLLLEECLNASGIGTQIPNRLDEPSVEPLFTYFGVWVPDFAAQYGYALPPAPAGAGSIKDWESSLTSAQADAAGGCMDSDEWRTLDITELMNLGASVRGERESFGWAKQTKEWANIVNQYQQCMSDLGYKFTKDQPFVPDGANSAVGEQSILVAIDDVQCKQQANLIQGLTDIVAAYEVSFIVSNEAALAEEQKMQQAKLDFADKIISSKS